MSTIKTIVSGDIERDIEDSYSRTELEKIASATQLGRIKIGKNLTVDEDGTLNAQAGGGGSFAFSINDDGDLILISDSSSTPNMQINSNGELIYTIEG